MGAIISTAGDEWPKFAPFLISGHIHDFQRLAPNLTYIGTPIQHSFGETQDKAIIYFESKGGDLDKSIVRVKLGLKPKVTVFVSPDQIAEYIPTEKTTVKLVIRGTEHELKSIPNNILVALREQGVIINKEVITKKVDVRKHKKLIEQFGKEQKIPSLVEIVTELIKNGNPTIQDKFDRIVSQIIT